MTKIFLFLYLCSSVATTNCKVVPIPTIMFDDMYDCTAYGYNYSHKLFTSFDREWANSMGAYFKFYCQKKEII